jgi:site-specific recombinase XerD
VPLEIFLFIICRVWRALPLDVTKEVQMPNQNASIESWLTQLEAHLQKEEYSSGIVRWYVTVAGRFLSYIRKRTIDVRAVQPETVCSFLRNRLRIYRRHHGRSPHDMRGWRISETSGIRMLLRLVHQQYPQISVPANEREAFHQQVCEGYVHWLSDMRGLAAETVSDRCVRAQQFLRWLGMRGAKELLHTLTVADIDAYLKWRAPMLRRPTCKGLALCLRCFLRYLFAHGLITRDLAPVVMSPTLYAFESIPSALRAEDVNAVLESTRQDRTPVGLRDYAILMLLSTYGLRAGEVVRLRLEDVEWRGDRLRVRHSKTGTESILPLLSPVGNAILDYLRSGRHQTQAREIFIRVRAPYRPLAAGASLYSTITRRLQKAGIHPQGKHGPHAFRHARAVSLLHAAVPVKAIGDVLGHRSAASTAIYLKLATADLRGVGLEVPGEVQP